MQANNNQQVIDSIKDALHAFYEVARGKTKGRFAKLPRMQRYQAARALNVLRDVADCPEKYFSRAATEADWAMRAQEYAGRKSVNPQWAAYYIVQNPAGVVTEKVDAAFIGEGVLCNRFAILCDQILHWYYDSTSKDPRDISRAAMAAKEIFEIGRDIRKQADIMREGQVMYYLKNNKVMSLMKSKSRGM